MDPKSADPTSGGPGGADDDENTVARKRSRRVSFAETTAVHVFARDEDFETPPDSKPSNEDSESSIVKFSGNEEEGGEKSGFHGEGFGSDEEEEDDEQEKFIRDMDSSSPGSVAGSVTSNDDDNFFGPVSTSFIKSGCLSELGMSDENNHDITLDSTAFSMHFQNVLPDDHSANSAGSFMTPTGDSVPIDSHNLVISKKHDLQKMGDGVDGSSNMTLIVEKQDSYGRFGKLSPTLDAILTEAEANKSLEVESLICGSGMSMSPHYSHDDASNKAADLPKAALILGKTQVTLSPKLNGHSQDCKFQSNAVPKGVQNNTLSPPYRRNFNNFTSKSDQVQLNLFQAQPQLPPILMNLDVQQQTPLENGMQTPQNLLQLLQSPLVESISSLRCKRQQLFLDPSVLSKTRLMRTPDKEVPLPSLKMKLTQHGEQISAIKIPKPIIEKSPIISGSISALSEKDPVLHEQNYDDDYSAKHVSVSRNEKDSLTKIANENVYMSTSLSPMQFSQLEMDRKKTYSSFDNATERVPTLEESSQTLDNTVHNTISSPFQILGDKLCASKGGSLSPRVDVTINFAEVSKVQSPKERENDSFLYQNQEQIKGRRNFQPENQDRNIVMDKYMENLKVTASAKDTVSSEDPLLVNTNELQATVNISTELGEKSLNSRNYCDKSMQHSPSKSTQERLTRDSGLNNLYLLSELSGEKRGLEQMLLTDRDNLNEESRTQKIPRILPDAISKNISTCDIKCSDESMSMGGQAPRKHWKDIFTKVSQDTKQPFPPAISKLPSEELNRLEDILDGLQTARKYERLYTSLRKHSSVGEHQQKRLMEARTLLDKLVNEKAKLQLRQMKLDKLSSKLQLCKSKVRECAKLKSMYSQFCILDARIVQNSDNQLHSNLNNSSTSDQIEYNRVMSMRGELETLDQKVKHLVKAFEMSCKIKGTMCCDEIIKVVNNHIEMKERCRLIRQDMQLWKLIDVVKKTDQCEVVLNYCNLLFQRFAIHSRSVAGIVANISRNNDSIEKNFPKMQACMAFEFVFKTKENNRLASKEQISQETSETNILLGILLDVLEEILVSRLQSWNLVSSTFHLECSGQLDLQLSFLSFKSGRKVTLDLDLTFLNCAIYPSKPSELNIQIVEAESTFPPSISNEILAAIESVESGRLTIVRLCQSISKVVQDLDG